jgi:hypothetical protein
MSSSKRKRSPSNPSKRQHTTLRDFDTTLRDFEQLLDPKTTQIVLISDNSTYSFVFYGVKRSEECFTLNGMSFNKFCMKISLVGPATDTYYYESVMTRGRGIVTKKYSTKELIDKEVGIQRRLDAIRMNGGSPIVPYVIDDCYLLSSEFENLGCWKQPQEDDKVMRVVGLINQQHRPVHMFFMEYIDTSNYETLSVRIPKWEGSMFTRDRKNKAYRRMAANLAIMPGCKVISYDAQENNALVDKNVDDLRSIDFGNAFDLEQDISTLIGIFRSILIRIHHSQWLHGQPKPTLQQLCDFFGVTCDDRDDRYKLETSKKLVDKFESELKFADVLVPENNTPENIHHNLIMTVFVDFMMYGFGINPDNFSDHCTCRSAMEIVYGKDSFKNFSDFLTNFRPRSIHGNHRSNLVIIQGIIRGIITPPPPPAKRTPGISCALMGGSNPTFIKRYLPDTLSIRDKIRQKKELMKSRRLYKQRKYYTRKAMRSFKSKPSKHIDRARTLYHVDKIRPTRELSRKTGCSVKGLRRIVKKGEGAYYSSGSRPNQTPQSWGNARLASAITGGNASAVDFHILNEECDHRKPAYRLAQKPSSSSRIPRIPRK